MDCKDISCDCKSSKECTLERSLNIQDIHTFFSNYTTCSKTYVYINQNGEGESRNNLIQ